MLTDGLVTLNRCPPYLLSKIRRLIKEAGLPPVKFEFDTFFTVTFKRLQSKLIIEQDKHTGFGIKFGIKGKN